VSGVYALQALLTLRTHAHACAHRRDSEIYMHLEGATNLPVLMLSKHMINLNQCTPR